ncbi:MAG: DNA methyltransferase, partial [Deltaproteobacteria bacterium]
MAKQAKETVKAKDKKKTKVVAHKTNILFQNKLFYGDNLDVLRKYMRDETIDLCYIDPPFNSKRNYNQIYLNQGSEDKAQAQAFVDTWTWDDFAMDGLAEIMTNEKARFGVKTMLLIEGFEKVLGKGSLLAYLIHITLRVTEIHRVLKPTGSFYFHCDPTASHYIKLVLDSIFCTTGGDFRNEIIWHYSGWNAVLNDSFNKRHDCILFYSKSNKNVFNGFAEKWKSVEEYVKIRKQKVLKDDNGSLYVMSDGGNGTRIKRYLQEAMDYGKPISNVWIIDKINNSSKERLGYPTQKPEALLERIIKASTNKGDIVLDAYCGCGTTVVVAEKLKRKWVGCDITYQSISLMLKRLTDTFDKKLTDSIELNGVPKDIESAIALANKVDDRTRKEFEKWCVLSYSDNKAMINEKKGSDGGIDGVILLSDYKSETDNAIELKNVYFSVKSDIKPSVKYIRDFYGAMQRDKAVFGIFICLYKPTKDMIEECKKLGHYQCNIIDKKYPLIKIVTVEEIFNGDRLEIPTTHRID